MFTEDDTLNAERVANSQNENENKNDRKTGQTLKTAASFVAGGAAGAAASFAMNAFAEEPSQQDVTPANEAASQQEQPENAATPSAPVQEESTTTQTSEPVTENNIEKPTQTHAQEPTHTQDPPRTQETSHTPKPTPASDQESTPDEFFEKNDVEIDHIVTKHVEGEVRHYASGEVNGHESMFIDDGHGNVENVYIDKNDNHIPDEDEIYDAKSLNMRMSHLAEHMEGTEDNRVAAEPINDNTEDEVKVISVIEDFDMGGPSVNVALVTINNEEAMYVDVTKNGEVDALMKDNNKDGQISENEVQDVRDQHIPMPTADEAEYASDELPNYSSDDDITLYDV